ncbi:helix-turn-helix domain-containing protein [Candidatus Latescibacterota bacterium]
MRKYRIDSGLLIKDFAKMLGVTSDTIFNWEKDKATPTTSNLNLIYCMLKHQYFKFLVFNYHVSYCYPGILKSSDKVVHAMVITIPMK